MKPWLANVDPWVSTAAIAQWMRQHGSPLQVYSGTALVELASGFRRFAASCGRATAIAYAVKACPAPAVLSLFQREGFNAEVNSENEYRQALAAGFPADRICINGVAKSAQLIDLAVERGCRTLNVDSMEEIGRIVARSSALGRTTAIHLRVCPDVVSGHSSALMTGGKHSQFGILEADLPDALEQLRAARSLVELRGIHVHVGSGGQLADVYSRLIDVVNNVAFAIERAGFNTLDEVNLGGGFVSDEITYTSVSGAETLLREIRRLPESLALVFEPGRFLVEQSSAFYCQIAAIKRKAEITWLLLDAGYCHLTDRAIVGTRFPLQSLSADDKDPMLVRIAGPLCDSADVYHAESHRHLPRDEVAFFRFPRTSQAGDIVEIGRTGAYVYSTGNHFAGFMQPAVLLIERNGHPRLIRRAEQLADVTAMECPA